MRLSAAVCSVRVLCLMCSACPAVLVVLVFQIFYTHAVAAVIVYDVTSRETFDSVLKWKQDIDAKVFLPSGAKIPVLLLGNKYGAARHARSADER